MKKNGFVKSIRLIICLGFFPTLSININSQVTVSEQDWVIPTYLVRHPDKNPMFFKGESYQGASRYIYPYALNDVISPEKTDKAWKALILENEYIKLCITPEIGGKLYYATDKTDNYNFVYKNNVVKPSNIGMLGAWVSGGIEWCVLHHHRASTFLPVDYTISENEDGSKTIRIGETEPRQRMRWTIGITAFPGKSYFMAEIKILNPTPYTHTFLYWANVATHTNKDYQVIFPPSVQVATFHAKNSFTHWPVSTDFYNGQDFTSGVDVSWWKNSPNSNSFFAWDLKEDFMGGYDHGKERGTVHIGDHNIVKGAKLWEWGSGPRGQATEGRLTETDGPYVEIMTGAFSDNQPDYSWISPYEVKTFRQYWYPVKDIEGFKNANLNGAVNLEKREKNQVLLGYCSTTRIIRATIILKNKGMEIFRKDLEISPERAFKQLIKVETPFELTDLYTEMSDSETGKILVSYQPVKYEALKDLPETVKRPVSPEDMATTEELYLTGSRIQQFGNPTLNAMDYFEEALRRDPSDIRTNIAIGNRYLKNGDYITARSYFSRAARRLTRDYTRPSDCEVFYLQGLTLKALGLYDEAADTLYRATWDYAWHSAAYLELARISSLNSDMSRAIDQVTESLSTNSKNNSALCLKASLLRASGKYDEAKRILDPVLENDPLDFRAANDAFLTDKAAGKLATAEHELVLLTKKMRDFDQNFLELAVGYINDGFPDEAEEVLKRFKGKNPIITYYLGALEHKKGNRTNAEDLFRNASSQSVDYCFPYRLETIGILQTALSYNLKDSRAYYYLGNILYDKQPEIAIKYWEEAVKNDSELAIAHRNLGWGYYRYEGDGMKAITEYEKAIRLKKDEPVYYEELDALYEMSNTPVSTRLALFDGNNETVSERDDAFARQLTVLTLAGQADKAVEYLEGRKFSYREGDSRVRDVIIDAHIMLGKKYFREMSYGKALGEFLLAQVPEEEASGNRSGNRNIQVDYFIGMAYEALGNRSKAKSYYTLSISKSVRGTTYINYYQGLSLSKLGKKENATEIFNTLVTEGDRLITQNPSKEVDFFAKFGEREALNARLSNAYLLKGLGLKGLGKSEEARDNLQKAVELSASNLYASVELQDQ